MRPEWREESSMPFRVSLVNLQKFRRKLHLLVMKKMRNPLKLFSAQLTNKKKRISYEQGQYVVYTWVPVKKEKW